MKFATLTALILTFGLIAGRAIEPRWVHDECDWAEPIRPSRADVLTDVTLAQIVAHNEIGERLCGWRP
ncbi:hypothetical protein [Tateyamaria pelophila]|uniref:hypothetical protein n=1 Tax=Tateyamaria pelophila TaxID=328415 RepID=UPI001CC109CA|nr:hypothetical protein [Tateyamaria pelophila]